MSEVLGCPCSLLIWDKQAYHKCAAKPIFESGKPKDFCVCAYVWDTAYGDMTTEKGSCPKGYSDDVLRAKIDPAITKALKERR